MLDESRGTDVTPAEWGSFCSFDDDVKRKHWYGLSDRGPGGGTLHYETRVQRFNLDIDKKHRRHHASSRSSTPSSSRTQLGQPLDGIAPESHQRSSATPSTPRASSCSPETATFPGLRRVRAVPVRIQPRRHPPARIRDAGQPDPARTAPPECPTSPTTPATRRGSGPTAGSRALPSLPTAKSLVRDAPERDAGRGSRERDLQPHRQVRQRHRRRRGPVRLPHGGLASQGRGISSLVALNDHEFLVLERNNRGVGVDAESDSAQQEGVPDRPLGRRRT